MQPARTCCLSWKGTSGARGQRWQCQVHLRGVPPLPSGKKEGNMGPCWEEVPPCVTLSLLYKDQVGWDENGLLLAGAICWECYFLKRVKRQRCFLVFLLAYKRCLRAISVSPAEKTYVVLRLAWAETRALGKVCHMQPFVLAHPEGTSLKPSLGSHARCPLLLSSF